MKSVLIIYTLLSLFTFSFGETLKIFSNKDQMQVFVNGKQKENLEKGYIELELPKGKYQVTLKKPIDENTEYSVTKNLELDTELKVYTMNPSKVMRKDAFERLVNTFRVEGFENKGTYIIPAMLRIKAGSFEKIFKKSPIKKLITIENDFYIGAYELTITEYMKFVNDTNSNHPSWLKKERYDIFKNAPDFYLKCPRGDCPIFGISWENAIAYTKWLSKKTNENYKLPSENQWEYAAKAGSTSKFFWGNDKKKIKDYASCDEKSIKKVGSKKPNEWKIFDTSGNVHEFCEDDYSKDYKNLTDNEKAYKEKDSKYIVRKGGAWDEPCSEFYQSSSTRTKTKKDWQIFNYGFRLVKTIR